MKIVDFYWLLTQPLLFHHRAQVAWGPNSLKNFAPQQKRPPPFPHANYELLETLYQVARRVFQSCLKAFGILLLRSILLYFLLSIIWVFLFARKGSFLTFFCFYTVLCFIIVVLALRIFHYDRRKLLVKLVRFNKIAYSTPNRSPFCLEFTASTRITKSLKV